MCIPAHVDNKEAQAIMENLAIVLALVSVSFALITIAILLFCISEHLKGIKLVLRQRDEPPIKKV